MKETACDRSLRALFDVYDGAAREPLSFDERIREYRAIRFSLFSESGGGLLPDPLSLDGAARDLFEKSPSAYADFLNAWMSEFPIEDAIIRFGLKTLGSEHAAVDRGDPDVRKVLEAAFKTAHETERLMGLLRFSPSCGNQDTAFFTARCSPDHHALPALAGHFTLRFGSTPWAIIDERRGIALVREQGKDPRFVKTGAEGLWEAGNGGRNPDDSRDAAGDPWDAVGDPWADLWRLYHHSVTNEARKNTGLQRQFMPVRYRKYLTEFDSPDSMDEKDPKNPSQGMLDL
jgi:probable DNA metabolism protein